MQGIYVHIPFCRSFCIYCDFYSERADLRSVNDIERMRCYKDALVQEIERRKTFFSTSSEERTIYFGGGTPSFFPAEYIEEVVAKLRECFFSSNAHFPPSEFTVEVNPDDINGQYVSSLKGIGVNRISMGIQSFDDRVLRWMRRRHSAQEAIDAFHTIREGGIDNISIDLIFGYTTTHGDSFQIWGKDIDTALSLRPEHISAYQLSIENGSSLSQLCSAGKYIEADEELCAREYSLLQSKLAKEGYDQYEVSNFALPSHRAVHNSGYWKRNPYIGIGAAAHSFDGKSRSWNLSDIDKYCLSEQSKISESGHEYLTEENILDETIMLGLRTVEGFPLKMIEATPKLVSSIEKAAQKGLIVIQDGMVKIPADKLFISDAIIREIV